MIQYIQNERSEREALKGLIKGALWLGGLFIGAPAFALSLIELVRMVNGK